MVQKHGEFRKPSVLKIARRVLRRGDVCDHCLGRQLARVSTRMTNEQRGEILRETLGAREAESCAVCCNVFDRLHEYADDAAKMLEKMEFDTFLVGTRLSPDLMAREESLWEDVGMEYTESIKSELNRELGKLIYGIIRKEVDEKKPDVVVLLDLRKGRIDLEVRPLFISGFYRKLVRGIPQTKWEHYDESVEDVIAAPVMKSSGGDGHSLHASGREDIDARCLDWRPFVLEISSPKRRCIDLKDMEKKVNETKRAEVSKLRMSERKEVVRVKSMRPDKTYSVVVEFSRPVKSVKSLEAVEKLSGVISQRTPQRVAHRRADKVRKRKVLDISWKRINNKKYEFQIKGEAGLYIKELVTGDGGRTKPSVSGLLKNPATVKALDVTKIWL